MRNLLAFMMALLLTLGGLGYYLDWFKLRTSSNLEGHTTLNIDWNSVKTFSDVAKGLDKAKELAEKKAKDATEKAAADKTAADKTAATETQTKPSGWFQ